MRRASSVFFGNFFLQANRMALVLLLQLPGEETPSGILWVGISAKTGLAPGHGCTVPVPFSQGQNLAA
jgi:hypothetical protein